MQKLIDITGMRFGRLVVQSMKRKPNKDGKLICFWTCKCDCGNTKEVRGSSTLRKGEIVSCGCRLSEWLSSTERRVHMKLPRKLHRCWANMLSRCRHSENGMNPYHAGRGIQVCVEWHSYINFRDWAMSYGWKDGLEIDRINNDLGYFPENCRFVDQVVQSRNRRILRPITYQGRTMLISEWADVLNVDPKTLQMRRQRGWSDERIIETPVVSKCP